jgi:hypothetical protein
MWCKSPWLGPHLRPPVGVLHGSWRHQHVCGGARRGGIRAAALACGCLRTVAELARDGRSAAALAHAGLRPRHTLSLYPIFYKI